MAKNFWNLLVPGGGAITDSNNPITSGFGLPNDGLDDNNKWKLNQQWLSPEAAVSPQQAYIAAGNTAAVTHNKIVDTTDLAQNADAMGGSKFNQYMSTGFSFGGMALGAGLGLLTGNPIVGSTFGGTVGSLLGNVSGYVTSIGSEQAEKKYEADPTLETMENAAKWDYWNGKVDIDVYNGLTNKGPSIYYKDQQQQKLLRKQVQLGAVG